MGIPIDEEDCPVCEEFKDEAMLPDLARAQLLERQGESERAAEHWER